MFERFNEQARRILFFGRYEASQLGSVSIHPEHMLLGIMREGKGLTRILLAESGVDPERIRQDLEERITMRERMSTSVEIPFSDSTKRVLELAAAETDTLGHKHIGGEHLLLGLLREGQSVAATILINRGMSLESARSNLVRAIPLSASEGEIAWTSEDRARPGFRAVAKLLTALTPVSRTRATVLILGGSPYTQATAVWLLGCLSEAPIQRVDCSAIGDGQIERTLATMRPPSSIIFLQDVASLPLPAQAVLLGALESGPVLGRLVATADADLRERVRQNLFREDLYYRLNVIAVSLPELLGPFADFKSAET